MRIEDVVLPKDDPAGKLAEFAANLKYEDIPDEHVDYIKKDVLDGLCSILAGSTGPNVPAVLETIRSWGEEGKGRALVYGDKLPMANAAFLNGTMARACDLGDTGIRGGHIAEWIIPTLLTALYTADRPVSGKEFITAFAAGAEWGAREHATVRLQENNNDIPGECAGSRYATVALGKMEGLDKDQLWYAAGMAFCSHTMHTMQRYAEGTPDARLQHGFISRDALTIVDLVKHGLHSIKGIYMSRSGLLKNIKAPILPPDTLTDGLGSEWLWRGQITNKYFAGCYYNHTPIYGIISLMQQYHFKREDIQSIHYITSQAGDHTWIPEDAKYHPNAPESAMWSAPYSVAYAAFYGDCFLPAFKKEEFEKNMADPEFTDLMQRCTQEVDTSIQPAFTDYICRVTLRDGTVYERVVDDLPGSLAAPMTWDQVIDKFWKCTDFSAVNLGREKYDKLIDLCRNLEEVSDVREFVKCLTKE